MTSPDQIRAGAVPDKVDMRRLLWSAEHIGNVFAAPASAVVTALEYHCNRIKEPPTNLSTMFVHYNARKGGDMKANRGVSVADALKAVAASGACRHDTWSGNANDLSQAPPPGAYDEARKFAGIHYYWIDDAIESLALSYPVAFSSHFPLRVWPEAGRGAMPSLTQDEIRNLKSHPPHAMALVGYDKTARTFLARNCWGDAWGDKGHCTISFDTMQVLCPPGSQRMWVITLPPAAKEAAPDAPDRDSVAAEAATAPTRAADLAKKLREEIRGSLDKDLADAKQKIKDMFKKPGGQ